MSNYVICHCLGVWGLDSNGDFLRGQNRITPLTNDGTGQEVAVHQVSAIWHKLTAFVSSMMKKKQKQSVSDVVMSELQYLQQCLREERTRFRFEFMTEKEKSKRLLYLFQKDLMPGISGQILESKDRRDDLVVRGVSRSAKWLTWLLLALLNTGMLFYIFLFAVSQEVPRQRAWARSFGMWLVVEVILVSSAMVFVTHVLIPSFVMSDVSKIKQRLLTSLQDYHKKMAKKERDGQLSLTNRKGQRDRNDSMADESESDQDQEVDPTDFNAAKFLFLSYKMARRYPELKIAQIISEYSTPWPKQSYHRATDVNKKYNRKFQAITKSATMIVMFFVTSFIRIPPNIQDMIMQVCTTAVTGYTVLVHIQLYHIYPVLIAIPTILLAAIIHFFVQSNKASSKLEFARLFGISNQNKTKENVAMSDEQPVGKDAIIVESEDNEMKLSDSDPDASSLHERNPYVRSHHRDRRQSVAHGIHIAKKAQLAFLNDMRLHDIDDDDESVELSSDSSNSRHLAEQLHSIVRHNMSNSISSESDDDNSSNSSTMYVFNETSLLPSLLSEPSDVSEIELSDGGQDDEIDEHQDVYAHHIK